MCKNKTDTTGFPFIDAFVSADKQIKIDYAYLLNGKWGCGKTWFVEHKLKEFVESKNKKLVYCSANGIKNIEQFASSVFLKILHLEKIAEKVKALTPNTSSGDSCFLENIPGVGKVIKGGISVLTVIVSTFGNSLLEKCAVEKDDIILVIDDLERLSKNINIEDLLGEINSLFIMNGIKVIFIADENRIENEKYRTVKEKYIRRTVNYELNKEDVFTNFVSGYSFSKKFKIDYVKALLAVYCDEEQPNLRTLKFSLDLFEDFSKCLEAEVGENVLSNLFYSICVFALMYKDGKYNSYEEFKNEITANIPNVLSEGFNGKVGSLTEKHSGRNGYILRKDDFIIRFVYFGELEDLKRCIDSFYEDGNAELFLRLENYQDLEFEELKEILDKILLNLKNKKYTLYSLTYAHNISDLYCKIYPNNDLNFEKLLLDSITDEKNVGAFKSFVEEYADFLDCETNALLLNEYGEEFNETISRLLFDYEYELKRDSIKYFIADLKAGKDLSHYEISLFNLECAGISDFKNKDINRLAEYIRIYYELDSSIDEEKNSLKRWKEMCEDNINNDNIDFLSKDAFSNLLSSINEKIDEYGLSK